MEGYQSEFREAHLSQKFRNSSTSNVVDPYPPNPYQLHRKDSHTPAFAVNCQAIKTP